MTPRETMVAVVVFMVNAMTSAEGGASMTAGLLHRTIPMAAGTAWVEAGEVAGTGARRIARVVAEGALI